MKLWLKFDLKRELNLTLNFNYSLKFIVGPQLNLISDFWRIHVLKICSHVRNLCSRICSTFSGQKKLFRPTGVGRIFWERILIPDTLWKRWYQFQRRPMAGSRFGFLIVLHILLHKTCKCCIILKPCIFKKLRLYFAAAQK